tara:strand:+ start:1678 stop:2580 length:903 start_codon:yes stop_codon:yes gene_type:complete
MKKIILVLFLTLCSNYILLNAQEATDPIVQIEKNDEAKVRFGLHGMGSVDWLTPENQKKFLSGGVGIGYGWGPQLEFRLNKKTMLRTGFNLYSSYSSIDYSPEDLAFDSLYFFLDTDENYVDWDEAVSYENSVYDINSNYSIYHLKRREFRSSYVNIPLSIKMKTNEIGYFTYFGEVGTMFGFKTKSISNDQCIRMSIADSTGLISPTPSSNDIVNKSDIDFSRGTQPIRGALTVGFGAEYNFSGTTSLFFAGHFVYDFVNTLRSDKREPFLRRYYNDNYDPVGAFSAMRSVRLSVGILF